MARGVKRLSLEEQLENLTKEICDMENSLSQMKETKKQLEEQIKINKLSVLDELISSKGLSYDDVMNILKDKE